MADRIRGGAKGRGLGSNNPYGTQAQQHWAEVEAARQARERQEAMLARFQDVQAQHLARHGPVEEQQPGQTAAPAYQTLPPSGAPQVTDTVRAGIDQQQWAQWQRDQSQWAERTLDPNAAAAAAAAAESMEPQYQPTQYPAAGYPSAPPPDYQTYAGTPQEPQVQQYGGPTLSPEQVAYYAQQAGQSSSHSGDEFESDELAAAALPEFHPGFQAAQSPMSPTQPLAPAPAPPAPNASNAPWIGESTLNPQQIAWIQSQMGSQGQGQGQAPAPQPQNYEGAWSPPRPTARGPLPGVHGGFVSQPIGRAGQRKLLAGRRGQGWDRPTGELQQSGAAQDPGGAVRPEFGGWEQIRGAAEGAAAAAPAEAYTAGRPRPPGTTDPRAAPTAHSVPSPRNRIHRFRGHSCVPHSTGPRMHGVRPNRPSVPREEPPQ